MAAVFLAIMGFGVTRYDEYERPEHRRIPFTIEYNDTYDYNDSGFLFA